MSQLNQLNLVGNLTRISLRIIFSLFCCEKEDTVYQTNLLDIIPLGINLEIMHRRFCGQE